MSDRDPIQTANEFMPGALPDQTLLLKLFALATAGSGAVLTPNGPRSDHPQTASGKTAELLRIMEQRRFEQITEINSRLDELDRQSDAALRSAQERLAEILRTANKTRDGRSVFQAEDGTIFDEHGNEVSADEIDWETWKADAWSWEDFQTARDEKDNAAQIAEKVDEIRERVDAGELTDEDLAAIDGELSALEASMPAFSFTPTAGTGDRSTSAAKLYEDGPESGLTVGLPFSRAVAGQSDQPSDDPAQPAPLVPFTFD
jgi:hypothetical protein